MKKLSKLIAFSLSLFIGSFLILATKSGPVSASANSMVAYTSANFGHRSYELNPATLSVTDNFGEISADTNWRCASNTNIANHAGDKIYQGRSCNDLINVIDVNSKTISALPFSSKSQNMALSPDDRYLYVAVPYYITKWDLTTNTSIGGSRYDNNAGINLGILPDGSKLYSASVQRNVVEVFNSSDLSLLVRLSDPSFSSLRWALPNPSGTEVWVGFGSTYKIIDTATDAISRTINASYSTSNLPSFSSDGSFLFTSSGSGLEKIDTSTGLSVQTYTGTGLANGTHAAISPDGAYVYVANSKTVGWVKISDGTSGSYSIPTTSPDDYPRTIAWSGSAPTPTPTPTPTSDGSGSNNSWSGTVQAAETTPTPTPVVTKKKKEITNSPSPSNTTSPTLTIPEVSPSATMSSHVTLNADGNTQIGLKKTASLILLGIFGFGAITGATIALTRRK